ncbi:MAG: LysM peptidoglycan-binding domain-containing protein [Gammaproteobacteria bacterium]
MASTPSRGATPAAAATAPASRAAPARAAAPAPDAGSGDAAATADLWQQIGFELRMAPGPRHPLREPLSYFHNSARFISEASARARPFLYHIHAEVTRRQLPYEILLLPIIESAYNPAATSPGGAAGIWQFMPATARRYGLHISRWYDGRRDVLASTDAALDYFEALRDRFMGDWQLVFAAYNCGERTVERAIERNQRLGRRTDFWSLDLPRSTRDYVPKMMALVEIVAHPAAHGVELAHIPATPYFAAIDVGSALDLNRVIDWSAMSGEAFDHLNAAFRKRYTVAGAPSTVLVPHERAGAVADALAALPATARETSREHVVAAGETLSHIAAHTGVPVHVLKQANGLRSTRLAVGQVLRVPAPGEVISAGAPAPARAPAARTHVVRAGDNLWELARTNGTSVAALARANGISLRSTLKPGHRMLLPGGEAPAVPSAAPHYEVRRGDSLWTISRRFKISVADLKRWNGLADELVLRPGQRLVVASPDDAQPLLDI